MQFVIQYEGQCCGGYVIGYCLQCVMCVVVVCEQGFGGVGCTVGVGLFLLYVGVVVGDGVEVDFVIVVGDVLGQGVVWLVQQLVQVVFFLVDYQFVGIVVVGELQ